MGERHRVRKPKIDGKLRLASRISLAYQAKSIGDRLVLTTERPI